MITPGYGGETIWGPGAIGQGRRMVGVTPHTPAVWDYEFLKGSGEVYIPKYKCKRAKSLAKKIEALQKKIGIIDPKYLDLPDWQKEKVQPTHIITYETAQKDLESILSYIEETVKLFESLKEPLDKAEAKVKRGWYKGQDSIEVITGGK